MFAKWKTFKTLRDKKGSDIILIPFSFHALEQFSRQMPGRQIQEETRIHFLGDTIFLALRSIKYKTLHRLAHLKTSPS